MAWIESNQELGRHPKAKRAARMLGVSVPAIIGHLHFLWWWCLEYAQDGDLSHYDAQDIADAASWDGDPEEFIHALLECGPGDSLGFLEEDEEGKIFVHDWMDYAGRLIEKRQANTKRMRNARTKNVHRTCSERAMNVQNTCNARAGATVPNRTVPNLTNINNNDDSANTEKESTEDVDKPGGNLGITKIGTQAVAYAEQAWGRMIPPGEAEAIIKWCDEFGTRGSPDPDALVIEAIKRALDQNVRKLAYVSSILRNWFDNGVTKVEHLTELDERHKKRTKGGKKFEVDEGDPEPWKSDPYLQGIYGKK